MLIAKVLILGIQDAINPFSLSTLLLFLFLLKSIKASKIAILRLGGGFTAAVILTTFIFILGYFDWILSLTYTTFVIKISYYLVSFLLLAAGLFHFIKWILAKQNKSIKEFEIKTQNNLSIIIFVILGCYLRFLSSITQSDYDLYLAFFYLSGQGNAHLAYLSFLIYSLANSLFLLLLLFVFHFISTDEKRLISLNKYNSYFELIFAAMYISTGVGVFYLMLT